MSITNKSRWTIFLSLCVFLLFSYALICHAETSTEPNRAPAFASGLGSGGGGAVGGSGTVLPDLFTGTMSYSIPIEVVPGRKGMQPNLALTYRSNSGNGWVGVGWDLEVGAIERSTRNGLDLVNGTDYVLRLNGSSIDLIYSGGNEYRAKIEGAFFKVVKNSTYWDVYDKTGTHYTFGNTDDSRQYDPNDSSKVFKWCLNRVEDTNGNFMKYSYSRNQGQVYLDQIDYTGNSVTGAGTTNYVKFYLEDRTDAPKMYGTNFEVVPAKRLKTIYVTGSGYPVRAYKLSYAPYSTSTGRSLLYSVQQFGKDAYVDAYGNITNESTASRLPAQIFEWPTNMQGFTATHSSGVVDWGFESSRAWVDFNGDGRADFCRVVSIQGIPQTQCTISTGSGFGETYSSTFILDVGLTDQGQWIDFNGDGKTDFCNYYGSGQRVQCVVSTGTGFSGWYSSGSIDAGYGGTRQWTDFDGDGKSDYCRVVNIQGIAQAQCTVSSGTGFGATYSSTIFGDMGQASGGQWTDFNGDGKADYCWVNATYTYSPQLACVVSTGTGFGAIYSSNQIDPGYVAGRQWADFNGDGKADFCRKIGNVNNSDSKVRCTLSRGTGFSASEITSAVIDWGYDAGRQWTDVNGDSKADYCRVTGGTNHSSSYVECLISTGAGFGTTYKSNVLDWGYDAGRAWADFDGDGKADYCRLTGSVNNSSSYSQCTTHSQQQVDLLTKISNGLGGSTTIAYTPSTQYTTNTLLPFPVQTVSSITTNDGNSVASSTSFSYSGGFYHIGDRDFRGFNKVTVTGPQGPNNEQMLTETWYHQGNDTALDANNPLDSTGYMKGKPYRARIRDAGNAVYMETETTYLADDYSPYFNPPVQVDVYTCDGKASGTCKGNINAKHVKTTYEYYTPYGNLTRENQYGDTSIDTDDRTIIRWYATNESNWIIGLPGQEVIYQGVYPGGTQVSFANYYYDGVSDCATVSTNWTPTKGNLTSILRWNSANVYRMAYDAYGNLKCTRDPNGNTTTISYDGTYTFPRTVANALGHQTITHYYGVDGQLALSGLYGQVKSVMDSNSQTTAMEYDALGRKKKATRPDGSWTSWAYNSFGTIGAQNISSDNSEGLTSWTYFDGLGRTTIQKKDGPDNKIIAVQTQYNATGTVKQTSLPYFDGTESARFTSYKYDSLGRVLEANNPDFTKVLTCYDNGVTVAIDANKHRKRQTRDALGRLVKAEEYTGTHDSCATDPGTPYSTTTYEYDVMGNLRFVTDTNGNQTEMRYDTLGRKWYMRDPDMGDYWYYTYDANGNLKTQRDAKGQTITFSYDALNRVTLKDYPSGTDVTYTYDETWSENPKGRLTTMTDASGYTKYYYNHAGRVKKTTKRVDGVDYTTQYAYDGLGRPKTLTYPDNDVVRYDYNTGGGLWKAANNADNTNYATYTGYNALGQPGTVTFKNGVATSYGYRLDNNLLSTILTSKSGQQNLLDLSYDYDAGFVNIAGITDNTPRTQQPSGVSEIASYEYPTNHVRPHAVQKNLTTGTTYAYDANGNMTSDGQRTIAYNYDNKPISVTMGGSTTSFVYDGNGARVKKITPYGTTIYIGKLYECVAGTCSKYIFAGGQRIVHKVGASNVVYYHPDHLGSTSAMSDANGAKIEDVQYQPFGATRLDYGSVSMTHKYTSQELDAETGLYYYNARYYNPSLGRFISPDTIIPDPTNPQAFNRYSYVLNNPLIYTDPSGHDIWKNAKNEYNRHKREYAAGAIIIGTAAVVVACPACSPVVMSMAQGALVGEIAGGAMAYATGGDVLTGVVAGGLIGAGIGYATVPGSGAAFTPYQTAGLNFTAPPPSAVPGIALPNWAVNTTIGVGAVGMASAMGAFDDVKFSYSYGGGSSGRGGGSSGGGSGGNSGSGGTSDTPSGYVDANVTAGYVLGVTGGAMTANNGVYPYVGGALVFPPGASGAMTWSPSEPTRGWNAALQVQYGTGAFQFGYGFGEGGGLYSEYGVGGPRGGSLSLFYVFEPYPKQP